MLPFLKNNNKPGNSGCSDICKIFFRINLNVHILLPEFYLMRIILFILLGLNSHVLFSQNVKIDSLQQAIEKVTTDTAKAEILLSLSYEYRNIDSGKSLRFAEEAFVLSDSINYRKGIGHALRNLGMAYTKQGKYDTAIVLCRQAIVQGKKIEALKVVADAYNTLGIIYYYQGELDSAVKAFEGNVEAYEKLNSPVDLAGAYSNLATILENKGDYLKALEIFHQALSIFEEKEHSVGQATVLFNMASIYSEIDEYSKALEYYEKTMSLDREEGNKEGIASVWLNISDLHLEKGDTLSGKESLWKSLALFKDLNASCKLDLPMLKLGKLYNLMQKHDSAFYYLSEAEKIARSCSNEQQIINVNINLGQYYYDRGDYNKSLDYLNEAASLARELDLRPILSTAYYELYRVHKQIKNISRALSYFEQYVALEEKLFNEKNTREIAILEAAYNFEKEKQHIENVRKLRELELKQEVERATLVRNVLIVAALFFTLLIIVIAILYVQKRRKNQELVATNAAINIQNEEIRTQNERINEQHRFIEEKNAVVERQKSDLEKQNKLLNELNEEKNNLIGIVAHDLKSPVNTISGLLGLMKLEQPEKYKSLAEYIDRIELLISRSRHMIDRILRFNEFEATSLKKQWEQILLYDFVIDIMADYRVKAEAKNIKMSLNAEHNIRLESDRMLLHKIVDNLLSNAVKYTQPGGEIWLNVKLEDEYVKFFIRDNGPGISKEDQRTMYDRYFRVSDQSDHLESSGLGLSIVKRFVQELEGSIECDSKPGSGTEFTLRFPIKATVTP